MSYRDLPAGLKTSLENEDAYTYAHLIKFEKPRNAVAAGAVPQRARDYAYLTDGSFNIKWDDGSQDADGTDNGEQTYIANKVLSVGTSSETIEAKATSMTLKLSATALNTAVETTFTFTSTQITAGVDLLAAGFSEGDIIEFSASGEDNDGSYVRIDSFSNGNKTINYTYSSGTAITSSGTATSYTATFASEEITFLTESKGASNYSSYLNRQVFVYRVHIDPTTGEFKGEPFTLFKGIITNGSMDDNVTKTSSITWTLTSHWGDFVQVNGRITSDHAHRALDQNGRPDYDAAESAGNIRYAEDLGFFHAENSVNVIATYQRPETRYKQKRRGGLAGLMGMKRLVEYEVMIDTDVDFRFNLQSKYLPVIYGVQKTAGVPIFAEADNADPNKVYLAQAICEGPIQSIMDVHVDNNPTVCTDKADSDARSSGDAEVLCVGRADKGDALQGSTFVSSNEFALSNTDNVAGTGLLGYIFGGVPLLDIITAGLFNNTGKSGITHERKFSLDSPLKTDIYFHAGRENQRASTFLVKKAQNSEFKIQNDYYSEMDPNIYWGAKHQVLDTAYVVMDYTIADGETTIPDYEYIVKGKVVDCYNYDYSYTSSGSHISFALGDEVTLYKSEDDTFITGTQSTSTVQIIDKWTFVNEEGTTQYRYRFDSNPQDGVSTNFYMKNTNNDTVYFQAYNHVPLDEAGTPEPISDKNFQNTTIKSSVTDTMSVSIITETGLVQITGVPTGVPEFEIGNFLACEVYDSSNNLVNGSAYFLPIKSYSGSTIQLGNSGIGFANATYQFLTYAQRADHTFKIYASDVVKLHSDASSTDNKYNEQSITISRIVDGTRVDSDFIIKEYDGTNQLARLDTNVIFYNKQVDSTNEFKFTINGSVEIAGVGPADRRVTTNPAMQLLDYLTNRRYGRGLDINKDIDLPSFLSAARICDSRSDITIQAKTSDFTTAPAVGAIYKYPASGNIKFQGKIKSIEDFTVSGTSFKEITFTDVIGKLGYKWTEGRAFDTSDVIWWNSIAFTAATSGTMDAATRNTRRSNNAFGDGSGDTRLNLTKVSGTGESTLPISVAFNSSQESNVANDNHMGNPIVKKKSPSASEGFISNGYSLYDSDDCPYWLYLGWDEPEQRFVTRHQSNVTIDTSQSVFANVNGMLDQFNGMLRYSNGKYSLSVKQAAPEDSHFDTDYPVKDIQEADIIGKVTLKDSGSKKTYNTITASIVDPQNKFGSRSITFVNSDYLKEDRGVKKTGNYNVPGISNYFNARINVKQRLDESRYGLTAAFTIDSKGYLLLAGDIIRISYSRFGWENKYFRIDSLNFAANGLVQVVATEHNNDAYLINNMSGSTTGETVVGSSQGTFPTKNPSAPTSGNATDDKAGVVEISWTNGTNFNFQVHKTEVARNDTNVTPASDGSNVTIFEVVQTNNTTDVPPGDYAAGDVTNYYWVRHIYSSTFDNNFDKKTAWLSCGQGTAKQTTSTEIEGDVTISDGGLNFEGSGSTGAKIRSSGTGYDSGNDGFFLGWDDSAGTQAFKFFVGDVDGNKLLFDGAGNLTITGEVSAETGDIGGFDIGSTDLSAGTTDATHISLSTNDGIHLGDLNFADAPFSVDLAGNLIATSATITGEITATSGSIANSVTIGGTAASTVESGAASGATALQNGDDITDGTVGGIRITGSEIKSSNFSSGSAGFEIGSDGDVEFNSGAFRGTLTVGSTDLTETNTLNTNTTATDVGLENVDNLNAQNQAQSGLISGTTITGGGITFSSGGQLKTINKDNESDTTNGFFLGYNDTSSKYTFGVGDSTNSVVWDGTDLTVTGDITADAFTLSSGATLTDTDDQIANTNNNAFFRYETTAANDDVSAPSDSQFNTAFGRNPRNQDVVIVVNTASDPDVSAAYIYNGSSWDAKNDFLTGDLLVDGTVTADHLNVTTLSAISADMGAITAGTLKGGSIPDADAKPENNETGSFFDLDNGKFVVGNATNNLFFDGTNLDVTGKIVTTSGTIGAINIGSTGLYSGTHSSYASTDAGFFLGSDGSISAADGTDTTFQLDTSGNVTITGEINATSGDFTGDVSTSKKFTAGSGSNVAVMDGDNSTYRFYAGAETPADAAFSVDKDGKIIAQDITIFDENGQLILDSEGLHGIALAGISAASGAGVDEVSGRLDDHEDEITFTTGSANEVWNFAAKVQYDINQNGESGETPSTSNIFFTESSTANLITLLGQVKVIVEYFVRTNSGSYSGTPDYTEEFTFVNGTSATSSQIGVNTGVTINSQAAGIPYADIGASEAIPDASISGARAFIKSNKDITFATADTYKIKVNARIAKTDGTTLTTSTTPKLIQPIYNGNYGVALGTDRTQSSLENFRRLYTITPASGNSNTIVAQSADDTFTSETGSTLLTSGGTISGDLTVTGNLTVTGSTNTITTNDLQVSDNTITLNYLDGDSSSTADGAGITIQDAVNSSTDASILWRSSPDYFDFSHALGRSLTPANATGLYVSANNVNATVLRIFQAAGDNTLSTSSAYGFSLKYRGDLSGNNNKLVLLSDNQNNASQNTVFEVLQDGKMTIAQDANFSSNVGIGTDSPTGRVEIADDGESNDRLLYLNSSGGKSGGQTGPFYGVYADIFGNNNATSIYGGYFDAEPGTGDSTYGLYAKSRQTSSTVSGIGLYAYAEVNSGSTNHQPSRDHDAGAVAGVYAEVTTYGTSMVAHNAALIAKNKSEYGSLAYGAYIDTTSGPTTVIPLAVHHDGNEKMRIDSSGNVGIGTSSPANLLHIRGGAATLEIDSSTNTANLDFDNSTQTARIQLANNDLATLVGGTERMRIDSSGNVGIGTTSPSQKLHVNGQTVFFNDNGATSATYAFEANHFSSITITGDKDSSHGGPWSNQVVTNGSNGRLELRTNNTAHLYITQAGNVGIGTDDPSSKLEVVSASTNSNTLGLTVRNTSSTNDPEFELGVGYAGYYDDSAVIRHNNNIIAYITSSGDWHQLRRMSIASNTVIQSTANGNAQINLYDTNGDVTVSSNANTIFRKAGSEFMRIDSSGNLLVGTTDTAPARNNTTGVALTSGRLSASKSGSTTIEINRDASDGALIALYRAGVQRANIGLKNNNLYLENGSNSIQFSATDIRPRTAGAGANLDATIDLGVSGARFKNLHLSGTISSGAITATGTSTLSGLSINSAFTFPTSDGDANQVLKTDGSGNVTWADEAVPSASTNITDADGDTKIQVEESSDEDKIRFDTAGTQRMIIDDQGRVGIGTTSPSSRLDVAGDVTVDGDINLGDNDKVIFGAGSDLQIYHDGSNSYITDEGTGNLVIAGTGQVRLESTDGERYFVGQNNGSAGLYYNDSEKLATTSTGIDVTGGIAATSDSTFSATSGNIYVTTSTTGAGRSGFRVDETSTNGFEMVHDNTDNAFFISRRSGNATVVDTLKIDRSTGDFSLFEDTGTTAKLTWDASAEALGIGTTSPESPVHIEQDQQTVSTTTLDNGTAVGLQVTHPSGPGAVANQGVAIALGSRNRARSYIASTYSGTSKDACETSFYNETGGVIFESMRIKTSGNVGIGTTSPAQKLHVDGNIRVGDANDIVYTNRLTALSNASLDIAGNTGQTITFKIGSSEAMRIKSSGSVGIGTTGGAGKLNVRGRVDLGVSSDALVYLTNAAGSVRGILDVDTSDFKIGSSGGGVPLRFLTSGSERMRIDSSGNVGIGTNSPAGLLEISADSDDGTAAPSFLITNASTTLDDGAVVGTIEFRNSDTSGTGPHVAKIQGIANASDERTTELVFSTGSVATTTERMRIDSSGNVGIGTTAPTQNLVVSDGTDGFEFSPGSTNVLQTVTRPGGAYRDLHIKPRELIITTNNSEAMRILTGGNVGIGTTSPSEKLEVTGTIKQTGSYNLTLSGGSNITASNHLYIKANGSYVRIDSPNNSVYYNAGSDHIFRGGDSTEYMRIDTNGANAGNVGIGTSSPSSLLDVAGDVTVSGDINLGDNDKVIFGAGSDLEIYHSGSESVIHDNGTGNLDIRADSLSLLNAAGSEYYARFYTNGSANLYNNGSLKLTTISTGVEITGNATFADNGKAVFGAGSDLEIYHDGSHSFVKDAGTGILYVQGSTQVRIGGADGTTGVEVNEGGDVKLRYNNANKLATTSTGIDVTGSITTDGMTTSADINFGDNDKAVFGAGSDLQIYHNGVHSYIADVGTGVLFLRGENNIVLESNSGSNYFEGTANGASRIYHAGNAKLVTTSTGIDVTGTITADEVQIDGKRVLAEDDFIQVFNPFGHSGDIPKKFFASHLTNRFGGRASELYVTKDSVEISDSHKAAIFDGSFDNSYTAASANDSAFVLNINTVTNGLTNSNGFTYVQGTVKLSFYPGRGPSVTPTARWKDRDGTYRSLTVSEDYTYSSDYIGYEITGLSGNWLTDIEITITPKSDIECRISEIEYHGDRMGLKEGPLLSTFGGTFYNTINGKFEGTQTLSLNPSSGLIVSSGFEGPYLDTSSGDLLLKRAGVTQLSLGATYFSGTTTGNFSIGHSKSVGQMPTYSWIGSLNTGMGLPATDTIGFSTANVERVRITNTGRMGIGTTNPAYPFHVVGNAYVQNGNLNMSSGSYGICNAGNVSQRMSFPALGDIAFENVNVGIGTTSPNAKLQIEEVGIDTTTTSTSATTQVAIDTFAAATFRSARYTIQVTNSTDSTYHITEILLIHDGTTPQITEYGIIFTGSEAEATFDADISSSNVRLLATPASTDSMTFKVVRHCITV